MDVLAFLANLDGLSVVLGVALGLLGGYVIARRNQTNMQTIRTKMQQQSSDLDNKKELIDQQLQQINATLKEVPNQLENNQGRVSEVLQQSAQSLRQSNQDFLNQLNEKSEAQTKAHIAELEAKKKLIDQQLQQMAETLKTVPSELDKNQQNVSQIIEKSTKSLEKANIAHLTQLQERSDNQTKAHIAELEAKKKLIDQQLQQMAEVLKTVPAELDKNQNKVNQALDKSTENLRVSNQNFLNQLTEKAEAQTKEHSQELEGKKELIDQRLNTLDVKLGKVEQLVQELQTDRKAQYGALGQQLQSLTQTTSALQKALADNQARGQWGERIVEAILGHLGFTEGINFHRQLTTEDNSRPDYTFALPNRMTLNMDVKFPLDNYLRYTEAQNETERRSFSDKFLRDVNSRVAEIQKRGYISAETINCVLIFIPNEQVYRFIHEQDHSIIDTALQQKVILCSPLTLYVVLAVIWQASQNFNIEIRSREIVKEVNDIRREWDKYTGQMDKLGRAIESSQKAYTVLTTTRERVMGRKFAKVEGLLESSDSNGDFQLPQLAEKNP